jgi:hypothetical protein
MMRGRLLLLTATMVAVGCQFDTNGTADHLDAQAPDQESDAEPPPLPPDAAPPDAPVPLLPDAAAEEHCPSSYQTNPHTRTSYRYVSTPVLWAAAEAACEAEGTHLVVVTDEEERNDLVDFMGKSPAGSSDKVWLGLTDRTSEGTWRFVTGAVATDEQLFWNAGEPNASGDCAAIYRSNDLVPSRNRHYDDADCVELGINRGYVCECDGEAVAPGAF